MKKIQTLCVYCGSSIGASFALDVAALWPASVRKLALISPFGLFEEKDPRGFKEFQTQLAEHSTEGSALTMQGVQRERPSLFDLEAGFKQMKVPTLVIAGDEDDPTLEPSMFLKRTIMSSALLVMPKCGHTMNLEDPDAFNRAVLDFVTQVDCGRWTQRIPESLSGAIIAAKEK